jgi:hypothetical protein
MVNRFPLNGSFQDVHLHTTRIGIYITYVMCVPLSMYKAPNLTNLRVTPELVRDELLTCFESANREFMRLVAQPVTDEALRGQVKMFVEGVFQKCGASYTNPTKWGITTAIGECKSNAEKMMGPQGADIIRHHYEEMMKLVSRLE